MFVNNVKNQAKYSDKIFKTYLSQWYSLVVIIKINNVVASKNNTMRSKIYQMTTLRISVKKNMNSAIKFSQCTNLIMQFSECRKSNRPPWKTWSFYFNSFLFSTATGGDGSGGGGGDNDGSFTRQFNLYQNQSKISLAS